MCDNCPGILWSDPVWFQLAILFVGIVGLLLYIRRDNFR